MPSTSAILWLVATPLGNPGDLSERARQALTQADLVLAEDTRRAKAQFARWDITPGRMLSFFEHNEAGREQQVLGELRQGAKVALMSDAGAPCIADPGYSLVRACRAESIPVVPIPGPSAVITALMASGLPAHPFTFLGFMPRKQGERKSLLAPFADLKTTLVFFERKNRVPDSLVTCAEVLGPREFCLGRELTKTHEEFILGRLDDLSALDAELLGEVTVVIGPPEAGTQTPLAEVLKLVAAERAAGGTAKDIARRVRDRTSGYTAKELYALVVESAGGSPDA